MIKVYAALNKWQRRTFSYGDADCCQFTAFIVKELTGKDFASRFNYSDEQTAYELVGTHGSLFDFIKSILGKPSDSLSDGDPCVIDVPLIGEVCGIKLRDKVVCLTEKGMIQVPDRYLLAGWSV